MIPRILGLATSVVGIVLFVMSIYGLRGAETTGHALLLVSSALHQEFRQANWMTHYTAYWATWIAAATLGMAGAVFLVMRRPVGTAFVVIGSVVVLAYPLVVELLGQRAYGFEYVNYPTAVTAGVWAVITVFVDFRFFRRSAS